MDKNINNIRHFVLPIACAILLLSCESGNKWLTNEEKSYVAEWTYQDLLNNDDANIKQEIILNLKPNGDYEYKEELHFDVKSWNHPSGNFVSGAMLEDALVMKENRFGKWWIQGRSLILDEDYDKVSVKVEESANGMIGSAMGKIPSKLKSRIKEMKMDLEEDARWNSESVTNPYTIEEKTTTKLVLMDHDEQYYQFTTKTPTSEYDPSTDEDDYEQLDSVDSSYYAIDSSRFWDSNQVVELVERGDTVTNLSSISWIPDKIWFLFGLSGYRMESASYIRERVDGINQTCSYTGTYDTIPIRMDLRVNADASVTGRYAYTKILNRYGDSDKHWFKINGVLIFDLDLNNTPAVLLRTYKPDGGDLFEYALLRNESNGSWTGELINSSYLENDIRKLYTINLEREP
ncbi:MAG: hypothetical protein HDS28_01145 [Bacteroides sp.]|nr:hypothetical protein [Bacteroides sp.]